MAFFSEKKKAKSWLYFEQYARNTIRTNKNKTVDNRAQPKLKITTSAVKIYFKSGKNDLVLCWKNAETKNRSLRSLSDKKIAVLLFYLKKTDIRLFMISVDGPGF